MLPSSRATSTDSLRAEEAARLLHVARGRGVEKGGRRGLVGHREKWSARRPTDV